MSDEDQKNYAQIVELAAAIKKKLCTTWRSEKLDKQAISDLKFAISKKKDIVNGNGTSVFDELVNDLENWIYEIDPAESSAISTNLVSATTSHPRPQVNTQTTL